MSCMLKDTHPIEDGIWGQRMISKNKYTIIVAILLLLIVLFSLKGLIKKEQLKPALEATPRPQIEQTSSPNPGKEGPPIAIPDNSLEPTISAVTSTPQPSAAIAIVNETTPVKKQLPSPFTLTECGPGITFGPINTKSTFVPEPLFKGEELNGIRAISAGKMTDGAGYGYKFGSSFAVREDGTLFAWGLRDFNTSYNSDSFPKPVKGLPRITESEGEFALSTEG
jgi:hypothetical protein